MRCTSTRLSLKNKKKYKKTLDYLDYKIYDNVVRVKSIIFMIQWHVLLNGHDFMTTFSNLKSQTNCNSSIKKIDEKISSAHVSCTIHRSVKSIEQKRQSIKS